jgi:hypothetical protein
MERKLDTFTTAFVEALLWSETDRDEDGNMGENFEDYSPEDIDEKGMTEIISDCKGFQREFWKLIKNDLSSAGTDFCLTRNGHGAGFWDGGWPEEEGHILTKGSKVYGTLCLMRGDDGKLYVHN